MLEDKTPTAAGKIYETGNKTQRAIPLHGLGIKQVLVRSWISQLHSHEAEVSVDVDVGESDLLGCRWNSVSFNRTSG